MMMERIREREVYQRITVSDEEIDAWVAKQRAATKGEVEVNLQQILVTVPENADAATVAARKARADAALARVKAGEDFATVAKEISEDSNREKGGEIGMRPAVAPARPVRRGGAQPGRRPGDAGPVALGRGLPRAEGGRAQGRRRLQGHADTRPATSCCAPRPS